MSAVPQSPTIPVTNLTYSSRIAETSRRHTAPGTRGS
jgi:hypothetical protein